jgi:hypothetical protein
MNALTIDAAVLKKELETLKDDIVARHESAGHVDIFTTPMEEFSDRLGEQISSLYSNEISNDLYHYTK